FAEFDRNQEATRSVQEIAYEIQEERKELIRNGRSLEYARQEMTDDAFMILLNSHKDLYAKQNEGYKYNAQQSKEAQEELEKAKAESAQAELAYQQKQSQIDNPAPLGVNNPVFSKITRKRGFMQYELMQKEGVKEMDYNAKVEKIINHMQK
ncbi:MAG: hypothetical protein RR885_03240, partial [Oscillospiraceae bacterium]